MGAINLNYNSDLVYSIIENNVITLRNKDDNELVYKFPIPRNFQLIGTSYSLGENRPTYIITPYELHEPQYIPYGYKDLKLENSGLWFARNDEDKYIMYIDTSVLTEQDFEYVTLGKFNIDTKEIPKPFWVAKLNGMPDYVRAWTKPKEIQNKVEFFDKNARLINEEELISIFALSDKGFEFCECLPEGIYDNSFFRDVNRYCLYITDICMDNWDIVVTSREDRNVYRKLYREKYRDCNEYFWYKNECFTYTDISGKAKPFHVFPVLDSESKIREEMGPKLVKKI